MSNTTPARAKNRRRRKRSSWLRLSWDWILSHPVSAELSDRELRAWLATVAGAVKLDRPDGSFRVDELERFGTPSGRRRVTVDDLRRFRELGLVDVDGDVWRVREWVSWSVTDTTAPLRGRLWRERQARRGEARESARAAVVANQMLERRNPREGEPRTGAESAALALADRDADPSGWGVPTWPGWTDEDEPGEAS